MCCRYTSADGELYKDVEGVLEAYCAALTALHDKLGRPLPGPGQPQQPPAPRTHGNELKHEQQENLQPQPLPLEEGCSHEQQSQQQQQQEDRQQQQQQKLEDRCNHEQQIQQQQVKLLVPVLELWDGVCCLFAAAKKPSGWLAQLLRALKLFPEEARALAASSAKVCPSSPVPAHSQPCSG